MSVAESIPNNHPVLSLLPSFPTKFKSHSFISFHFPSSSCNTRLLLSSEFVSRRERRGGTGMVGEQGLKPAFSSWRTRDNGDDSEGEGIRVLEQEPLVGESSSQSLSNFVSGGLESTFNRLSKWLVSGVSGFVILWRHDGEALWAVIGSILNAVLSVALKQILNQERPVSTGKSDPGMPSSHAQSIFFIVVLIILTMIEELGLNSVTLILSGLTFGIGSYLSWLRVSQQFHTVNQVVVGAAVGFSFAIAWFWCWHAVVYEQFDSHLWVKVSILLGAAACGFGFLVYVLRTWFTEER
ncbi:hypothetical protein Ancab_026518 [Ancistrocladus abbreviatus]